MLLKREQELVTLRNKPCGMTPEEQIEYERVKAEADEYYGENDRLSQIVAELSAENFRLRSTIRAKTTSSSTSSTDTNSSKNSKLNRQLEDVGICIDNCLPLTYTK